MLRRNLIPILILIIIFAFIVQPGILADGAFMGLNIWINNIVPFLFPMFILSNILLQYNLMYSLLDRFSVVSYKALKSKFALIPYFISIISGYPSGAVVTNIMAGNKKISSREANYTIIFTNNCSLQFISAVVAFSLLGNHDLFIYIAVPHYAGALILSVLYKNNEFSMPYSSNIKKSKNLHFNEIFSSSIYKAVISILTVGGVIVFFSVFSQYVIKLLSGNSVIMSMNTGFKDILFSLLIGILEVTNGCKIISASPIPIEIKLIIINFLISFSGMSIIFQTIAVSTDFNFNTVDYIKGRFLFGIISSILCICMLYVF